MVNVDRILSIAKQVDASDVHLIYGMKPILNRFLRMKNISVMRFCKKRIP